MMYCNVTQLNEKAKTTNNGLFLEAVQNTHSTCFIKSKNSPAMPSNF